MNGVRTLGYLGIHSAQLDDWRQLGQALGTEVVDRGDQQLDIRLDRRAWRVRVEASDREDLAYAGWEVADDRELDALVEKLGKVGHVFEEAPAEAARTRQVERLVRGTDPDGNTVELFHSAAVSGKPFVSPHQVTFETGLGVGHMVLWCGDVQAMLDFYRDGLGLRVTDTIHLSEETIYFLRCNERHHSLALVGGRDQWVLQHLMFETDSVDAVGAAYERCHDLDLLQTTLGRHSNDEMFSFYAMVPGGYTIEYGHGGRLIDERTHQGAGYVTTSWWATET
ncbi:VOC family protein [Streptomyces tuirus]|uniref:VOC family protein n=1 Tax=Streptomyces tuirus TaxID=68278 RepID=A0A941FB13_9ACTN|nr:VOC family protein [Streptomyces tuirus]